MVFLFCFGAPGTMATGPTCNAAGMGAWAGLGPAYLSTHGIGVEGACQGGTSKSIAMTAQGLGGSHIWTMAGGSMANSLGGKENSSPCENSPQP